MADYREIPSSEAAALVAANEPELAKQIDFLRDEYENEDGEHNVRLYSGDVSCEEFAVKAGAVLVGGNLVVEGLVSDCAEADRTLLVVLGDVVARDLHASGEMIVGGRVTVERLVYLNSRNDCSFLVHGSLSARALVEAGMFTWIGGDVHSQSVLSVQNEIRQGIGDAQRRLVERRATDPRLVFLPKFLDGNAPIGHEIYAAQKAGREVLV